MGRLSAGVRIALLGSFPLVRAKLQRSGTMVLRKNSCLSTIFVILGGPETAPIHLLKLLKSSHILTAQLNRALSASCSNQPRISDPI